MQPNDHDLLVRIDERVKKLDTCMSNHLKHHWAVTLMVAAAAVGAVGSVVIALFVH